MASSPAASDVPLKGATQQKSRTTTALLAVGALVVILGLALGLGLGLGLKHHHHDTSASSTSPSNSAPSLVDSPQTNFVLGGLQGQAPQTRTYYFTIAEATGAPDGVSKPMLVVNGASLPSSYCNSGISLTIWRRTRVGMFPGPTIEANQHDRLVVNVTNHLPNTT